MSDSILAEFPNGVQDIFSVNNRLVLESYKADRTLKANVSSGFAMVAQKSSVVGLRLLAPARISIGDSWYVLSKGSIAYIREEVLHTAIWAQKTLECDLIEGKFIITDISQIEFVVNR